MEQESKPSQQPDLPPGWTRPKPEALVHHTWWPAFLALGATFIVWGLITSYFVLTIGLITFAVSLAGWIGDIRDEHKRQ